jgi:Transglutaminase-like superfamily
MGGSASGLSQEPMRFGSWSFTLLRPVRAARGARGPVHPMGMSSPPGAPLPIHAKLALAARVWASFTRVRVRMMRTPLPRHATRPTRRAPSGRRRYPATTLSRAVHRSLRAGGRRPTCLMSALVLTDLLRAQGDDAEVVIGLPDDAKDHRAHAWVELGGTDVGPPPGRGRHAPLARFGPSNQAPSQTPADDPVTL